MCSPKQPTLCWQDVGNLFGWRAFAVSWASARRIAKPECSLHDLRHFAGTLNATAGATTKEATIRLGMHHPTSRCPTKFLFEDAAPSSHLLSINCCVTSSVETVYVLARSPSADSSLRTILPSAFRGNASTKW